MDSNKMLTVVAISIAIIAISLSAYAIVEYSHSDDSSNGYSDSQIDDLVSQLNQKGGLIRTINGSFDIKSGASLYIDGHVIVNNHFYIPFSSIDYIKIGS